MLLWSVSPLPNVLGGWKKGIGWQSGVEHPGRIGEPLDRMSSSDQKRIQGSSTFGPDRQSSQSSVPSWSWSSGVATVVLVGRVPSRFMSRAMMRLALYQGMPLSTLLSRFELRSMRATEVTSPQWGEKLPCVCRVPQDWIGPLAG